MQLNLSILWYQDCKKYITHRCGLFSSCLTEIISNETDSFFLWIFISLRILWMVNNKPVNLKTICILTFVNGEQISQLQTNMYYNIVCIFNMFSLLLAYEERKWRKPFSYKCIINSLNLSGQLQVFSRFFGTSFLPCHLYCIVLKKWMSLFINTAGTWQLICITGSYLMDLYDEIGALLFY